MKKIFLPFIAIAIMTFFVACSNEDLITEENTTPEVEAEGQTLSLTVSMPNNEPATRVALDQDDKNINLRWQEGDRLQFAIVQGTIKEKKVIPLEGKISNNGKTVTFNIPLPTHADFDQNADFDLYGVYGHEDSNNSEAGGISEENPTNVILTKNPGSINNTLTAVQNRGDVMLYFKETGVNLSNPLTSVTFKHLGSLFAINFYNFATSEPSNVQVRLVGVNEDGTPLPDGNWAYNNGAGGQIFDLLTEEFQDITTAGNYISFATAGNTWVQGTTTTLWGWYPPIPNEEWPALRLVIEENDGTHLISSNNFKPARNTPPEAGKAYHFYASFNEDNTLSFVDPFPLD